MLIGSIVSGFSGSSLLARTTLNRDMARYKELFANEPTINNEVEYFKENISSVESLDDLVDDQRLLRVVLSAHGLEDQTYARALIKKVVEEGTDDSSDMANQMVDSRYKELAQSIAYDTRGLENLKDPTWQNSIIDKFIQNEFEVEVGAVNENLRLAMYFERKAPKVTSYYQLLGDKALYEVTLKAAGLPSEMSSMDIDKQVSILEDKFKLSDLRDPDKLSKMVETFLVRADAEQNTAASNPTVQLMASSAQMTGYSPIVTIDPTLFIGLN